MAWPPAAAASFTTTNGENWLWLEKLSSSTTRFVPSMQQMPLDEALVEALLEEELELEEELLEELVDELLLEELVELVEPVVEVLELDELLLEEELVEPVVELEELDELLLEVPPSPVQVGG